MAIAVAPETIEALIRGDNRGQIAVGTDIRQYLVQLTVHVGVVTVAAPEERRQATKSAPPSPVP